MSVSFEDLRPLLAPDASPEDVVAFLAPLSEADRRALAPRTTESWERSRRGHDVDLLRLAVLGCSTGVRHPVGVVEELDQEGKLAPYALRVLADRSTAWLTRLTDALVRSETSGLSWWLVRSLVRDEVVPRPASPRYPLAMIQGLSSWSPRTVLAGLRADPALLTDELWDMLGHEGAGRALAQPDSYYQWADSSWVHALVTLQSPTARDAGPAPLLDRARLLDVALRALRSDRASADVRWFVRLHDALEPTGTEVLAAQEVYLDLLASTVRAVVTSAGKALDPLVTAPSFDADGFLAVSPAVLLRPEKALVTAHLTALVAVADSRPVLAPRVADVVSVAVEHPHPDVRERATCLRQRLTGQPFAGDAPGTPGERTAADGAATTTTRRPPRAPIPEPAPAPVPAAVAPVRDVDELVDLFTALLEDACDVLTLERALDGVARLARERPSAGAGALADRARDVVGTWPGPWQGASPCADVAALVLAWLDGTQPAEETRYDWLVAPRTRVGLPVSGADSLSAWWSMRVREVAVLVARGGGRLLALPSAEDWTVSRTDLAARLREVPASQPALPFDLALATLRSAGQVDPPGEGGVARPERAVASTSGTSPTVRALVTLQDRLSRWSPQWSVVTGPSPTVEDEGPVTVWQDDNPLDATVDRGPAVRALDDVLDRSAPLLLTGHARHAACTHAWGSILPHRPELLAAHASVVLAVAVTSSRDTARGALDALGRARTAGTVTASALVLGLSAKDPVVRVTAVDAVVDLWDRACLDPALVADRARRLLDTGEVVGRRVAESLGQAARASPRAAHAVHDVLVGLLPAVAARRDAHLFVGALTDTTRTTGRDAALPAELVVLADGRSRSVLATACRRLLAARVDTAT
ncbi:DUF6493 family protein [Oerskovia jenensis]|uniref:DUF6493 family protein n=1 Tax=Oerskovia jenensis TaxID=162169 RepID=UPI0036DE9D1A